VREKQASGTTTFLEHEAEELREQINELQNKISEFKKAHIGELPEYNSLNFQAITRLNRDLDQVNMQIHLLKERMILLNSQLASVDPLTPIVTEEGKTAMNPADQLKYLRLQLISLQSTLSEKHPDVKKVKRQIEELEQEVEVSDDSILKVKQMQELKDRLAAKKSRLGRKHPDVVSLTKQVDALSKELKGMELNQITTHLATQNPDNPAYINLKTQVDSTELEIKRLSDQKRQIEEKITEYERKMGNAPLLEKEYSNLLGDYGNAKSKYNEIMSKLMEARVAHGMEETQRGERFTMIDPAQLPEKPHKPNRIAIVVLSMVLALAAGTGIAAGREALDGSIKTVDELTRFSGVPVLSVIPLMVSEDEIHARQRKRALFLLAALVVTTSALVLFHHFVMPLDILWIKIHRKLMM